MGHAVTNCTGLASTFKTGLSCQAENPQSPAKENNGREPGFSQALA